MSGRRLGQVIKTCRKKAGMTQVELGEAVGVANVYLSKVENGHKVPSESEVRAIALELDQQPGYFIDRLKEEQEGTAGDDGGTTASASGPPSDDGCSDDDGGDMPPWEREPDRWAACARKGRERLGTDRVTVRSDGSIYMSAALARAASLKAGQTITLYKSASGGGLQVDPDGDYALSNEGDTSGLRAAAQQYGDWTGEECRRAEVTGYGDGWVAFARPEEG